MEKKSLATGHTLLVSGPASLILLEGEATVLGAPLEEGEKIVVREEKQLALEAVTNCIIQTSLGEEAKSNEVEGSTIPNSWKEAVLAAQEFKDPRVVVLGAVDSGKTTLCTFLVNTLVSDHLGLAVIDADLGQADIGPPAALSLAVTDECLLSLSELNPAVMFFVGHTSPALIRTQVLVGLEKLMEHNPRSRAPLVVNTDGWIGEDEADLFKAKMISSVAPDLVIGIERRDGELDGVVSSTAARSIVVKTPNVVRVRSREERRRLRELNYRRFLEGGIIRQISFRRTQLRGIEIRDGRLRGVAQRQNSLVGFLDEDELLLDIGVLKAVDQREGLMRVFTKFAEDPFILELGSVKIDERGREVALNELCPVQELKQSRT